MTNRRQEEEGRVLVLVAQEKKGKVGPGHVHHWQAQSRLMAAARLRFELSRRSLPFFAACNN